MTAPDNQAPSTSWAVWAWQAYRDGRLVEALATPAAMTPEIIYALSWAKAALAERGVDAPPVDRALAALRAGSDA